MSTIEIPRFFAALPGAPIVDGSVAGGMYAGLPGHLVAALRGNINWLDFRGYRDLEIGTGVDQWTKSNYGTPSGETVTIGATATGAEEAYSADGILECYAGAGGADTGFEIVANNKTWLPFSQSRYASNNEIWCGFRATARPLLSVATDWAAAVGFKDIVATAKFFDVSGAGTPVRATGAGAITDGVWVIFANPSKTLAASRWSNSGPYYTARVEYGSARSGGGIVTLQNELYAGNSIGHTSIDSPHVMLDVVMRTRRAKIEDSAPMGVGSGEITIWVNGLRVVHRNDWAMYNACRPFVSVVSGSLSTLCHVDYFWSYTPRQNFNDALDPGAAAFYGVALPR